MILYHNPQCSKSRQLLTLLQENGVNVSIVEYLKAPLTVEELETMAQKLNLEPRQFMRQGESEYENFVAENLTRQELFEAIVKYPRLLERPIAVTETKAVIGRPLRMCWRYCESTVFLLARAQCIFRVIRFANALANHFSSFYKIPRWASFIT